jgi:hypothetical protein
MRRLLVSLLVLGISCTGDGGGGTSPGSGGHGGGTGLTGGHGGATGGSASGAAGSSGGSPAGRGGSTGGAAGAGATGGGGGSATAGSGGTGAAGHGGANGVAGVGGMAGRGGASGVAGSGAAAGGSAGRGGAGGSGGRGGSGGSAGSAARGGSGGGAGSAGRGGSGGGAGSAGRGGSGGSAGGAGSGGVIGAGGTAGTAGAGALFDLPHPWTTDVSGYPKAATSDTIINGLIAAGGWGQNDQFLTDASILILADDGSAPTRTFTRTADFYTPDCDNVPFPVPPGGAVEGESGYACAGNGDCHLIVVQRAQKKLFEMWRANITGTSVAEFRAGCVAVWDLAKQYGSTLRGKGCSAADAGGFPMTAMLATSDEVAAGRVGHALRFILPNDRIRDGIYVPPGTHSTGPTAGGPATPPYGVRFRLKATFDTTGLSAGAKVLAQALKTYGMFLADGGNIALTIASDRLSAAKWSALGITNNRSLASLAVGDFEVVDYGAEVDWNADTDCIRNP